MIIKTQKVVIFLVCLLFLASITSIACIHLTMDVPGFISLGDYSHSGDMPHMVNGLININIANAEQLQLIPRIGPGLSARIIEDRQKHGPFQSPDDIMRVKGIGQKTFESIQFYITTGG